MGRDRAHKLAKQGRAGLSRLPVGWSEALMRRGAWSGVLGGVQYPGREPAVHRPAGIQRPGGEYHKLALFNLNRGRVLQSGKGAIHASADQSALGLSCS